MENSKTLIEIKTLRETKERLGWTNARIGYKIGVSGMTIGNWFEGRMSPSPLALKAIREFLLLS